MRKDCVSIALCTCNGERYLGELLDSLSAQSTLPCELVVCDDCSGDSTGSILEDYARSAPFQVRVLRNSTRLGIVRNFEKALAACRGEYIAPCDQDDVWMPDKLERLCDRIAQLAQSGQRSPFLVHSDLELTGAALQRTGISYLEHQGLKLPRSRHYRTLLVQNYIPGCSAMFSRDLLEIALPIPLEAVMHDWWLALLAAAAGSITFDPARTVLYRQHAGNQLGSPPRLTLKTATQVLAIKPALDVIRSNFRSAAHQAIAAQNRLRSCHAPIPGEFSAYIEALTTSRLKTLRELLAGRIGRANAMRNLALVLGILLTDTRLPGTRPGR